MASTGLRAPRPDINSYLDLRCFDQEEDSPQEDSPREDSPRSEASDTSDGEGDSEGEEHPLDQDIYGAAIFTMIKDGESLVTWSKQDVFHRRTNLVQFLFVMVALLANFSAQFWILWYSFSMVIDPLENGIFGVYSKFRRRCYPHGPSTSVEVFWKNWADFPDKEPLCNIALSKADFLAAILWIWTLSMFEEFKKIEHQTRVLLSIPITSNPHKMVSRDEDLGILRIKRITPCLRAALIGTVIVPKILIMVFLTIVGFVWLTGTGLFADLILNAVALVFVIHIDEQIYLALLPNSVKAHMAGTVLWSPRRAEKTPEELHAEASHELLRCIIFLVASIVIVALYLGPGQWFFPIIPGFNGDIDILCKERRAIRTPLCSENVRDCFPVG